MLDGVQNYKNPYDMLTLQYKKIYIILLSLPKQ